MGERARPRAARRRRAVSLPEEEASRARRPSGPPAGRRVQMSAVQARLPPCETRSEACLDPKASEGCGPRQLTAVQWVGVHYVPTDDRGCSEERQFRGLREGLDLDA